MLFLSCLSQDTKATRGKDDISSFLERSSLTWQLKNLGRDLESSLSLFYQLPGHFIPTSHLHCYVQYFFSRQLQSYLIILRKGILKFLCSSEKCVLSFAHTSFPLLLDVIISDFSCFLWTQGFLTCALKGCITFLSTLFIRAFSFSPFFCSSLHFPQPLRNIERLAGSSEYGWITYAQTDTSCLSL